VYPLTLVRTRLMLQQNHCVYRGMTHCFRTILAQEGALGLYAGFGVKSLQTGCTMFYVATYESLRLHFGRTVKQPWLLGGDGEAPLSTTLRSFFAGGMASFLSQSLVVPIDIVSQHLMVLSRPSVANNGHEVIATRALTSIKLTPREYATGFTRTGGVIRHLFRKGRLRAFYSGYFMSLASFVPNSALWWSFYTMFCDWLDHASVVCGLSESVPRLAVQLMAAPCAGISSGFIMNSMDVIRVRMQIERTSFMPTLQRLWREEGLRLMTKGLTARFTQSAIFSFWLMLFYEPAKQFCLRPEHRLAYDQA